VHVRVHRQRTYCFEVTHAERRWPPCLRPPLRLCACTTLCAALCTELRTTKLASWIHPDG
jgi:hypothetical protein